ncbi:hypothetical protein [Frigidibacter sp. MR17.24]|uniref:hypothetical protein n=1 Tax=Frigidibacter sp. MR17.24 TaxID=3127345 RepID=UPI0030130424
MAASIAAARPAPSLRETQIDRTTANARRVVDDETLLRAEKTAALKAAREKRDLRGEG